MDVRTDDVETVTANSLAIDPLTLNSVLRTLSLAEEAKGNLWELDGAMQPANNVAPLAQISSASFYQIEEQIFPDRTYLFQVRVKDADGIADTNSRTLVYRTQSAKQILGDYNGCTSVTGKTPSSVEIIYEFPEEAEQISVFRDGEQIYSTKNHAKTTYTDWGLSTGNEYEYNCKLTVNGEEVEGAESIFSEPQTPLEAIGRPFDGCISGTALSTSSIQIEYDFRDISSSVHVYRNGIEAFATIDQDSTTFIDTGLEEGVTYEYTCGARVEEHLVMGSLKLPITTLMANAPTFAGVISTSLPTADSIKVTWGAASGVPVSYFNVWAVNSGTLDMDNDPITIIKTTGNQSTTLTNIGEGLEYTFGARACNASDQCDTNVASLTRTTVETSAPPTTSGATAITIVNGKAQITAPWTAVNGAVLYRKLYISTTGGTNIGNYVVDQTTTVINPQDGSVPTTIESSVLLGTTTYYFIVRDEDTAGNENASTSIVTVTTGDVVAPSFVGITSPLSATPAAEESSLRFSFSAIDATDPDIASHYLVYLLSGSGNACTNGNLVEEFDASVYANSSVQSHDVTGLSPRLEYTVCLKARDITGNISNNPSDLGKTRHTLDTTPPAFVGLQSITWDSVNAELDLGWSSSVSSDIKEYRIKIWKNNSDSSMVTPTLIIKDHATYPTLVALTSGDFSVADNDVVYGVMYACDDAGDVAEADAVDNCSAIPLDTAAKVLTIPDTTPPSGWLGISSVAATANAGELDIVWNAASPDWTDYAGFKIYSVGAADAIIEIANCSCTDLDCVTNPITTCTATLLDQNRSYTLHVRPYDAAFNETPLAVVSNKSEIVVTKDLTAPTFNAGLTSALNEGDLDLSWAKATDNQFSTEPGSFLTYFVYQKTSTFGDVTQPELDGTLQDAGFGYTVQKSATDTTTPLTYPDTTVVDSATYYYAVCVEDNATPANRTCDPADSTT
jgi:hypothetical protein